MGGLRLYVKSLVPKKLWMFNFIISPLKQIHGKTNENEICLRLCKSLEIKKHQLKKKIETKACLEVDGCYDWFVVVFPFVLIARGCE